MSKKVFNLQPPTGVSLLLVYPAKSAFTSILCSFSTLRSTFSSFVAFFWLVLIGFTAPIFLSAQNTLTSPEKTKWLDKQIQSLSLEEKIGQLMLMPAYSNGDESYEKQLLKDIKKYQPGGLIYFNGGPGRQLDLMKRVEEITKLSPFNAMRASKGLDHYLDSIDFKLPSPEVIAATRSQEIAYESASALGTQLKSLGIHIHLGLELKELLNEHQYQGFGEDSVLRNKLVIAYLNGLQSQGIIVAPGHFSIVEEIPAKSFLSKVRYEDSPDERKTLDWLIKGGSAGISTYLPQLEYDQKKRSFQVNYDLSHLLRHRHGFEGLLIGEMPEDFSQESIEDWLMLGLHSGHDLMGPISDPGDFVKMVKQQIRKGQIEEAHIDQKLANILSWKYDLALHKKKDRLNYVAFENADQKEKIKRLQEQVYQQGITLLQNAEEVLPIRELDLSHFASVSIGNGPRNEFPKTLRKYAPFIQWDISSDRLRRWNADSVQLYLDRFSRFDYLIVSFHPEELSTQAEMRQWKLWFEMMALLPDKQKKILVNFAGSEFLAFYEPGTAMIESFGNHPIACRLVPQMIFGALPFEGRLPYSANSIWQAGDGADTKSLGRLSYLSPSQVGMDAEVLKKIDAIAHEAIQVRATPGCQVLVARKGVVVHHKSYGYQTYDSLLAIDNESIYDLASITKVASTLPALMFLYENGLIKLDQPLMKYMEDLKGSNKGPLRIDYILAHQAGLKPYIPLWQNTLAEIGPDPSYYSMFPTEDFNSPIGFGLYGLRSLQDSVWNWVISSDLARLPRGNKYHSYKYSDLGYFMLKKMSDQLLTQPTEEFITQNFYHPLGIRSLTYLPLCHFSAERIVPTEEDNYFRNSILQGLVHDQNAALYGGIAGHAGLFGNANDLAIFMQMQLNGGSYGGQRYFKEETIEKFASKAFDGNRRGLGWDKPALGQRNNPTSSFASPKTYGHTGFTGTAVWVDPDFDLVYVFLSNRVQPSASNRKLNEFNIRNRIQDVLYQSIFSYEKLTGALSGY